MTTNNTANDTANHNAHVVEWHLHRARRAEESAFIFSMPWCSGHLARREVDSGEERARYFRALAEQEKNS